MVTDTKTYYVKFHKGKHMKESQQDIQKRKLSEIENYSEEERVSEAKRQKSDLENTEFMSDEKSDELDSHGFDIIRSPISIFEDKVMEHIEKSKGNTTGMTEEHNIIMAKSAAAQDMITIWRPINKKAKEKLSRSYMGKGITVKGKSSEFGPIAGDIPVNAALSKLASEKEESKRTKEISKFQKLIDDSISKDLASLNKTLAELENTSLHNKSLFKGRQFISKGFKKCAYVLPSEETINVDLLYFKNNENHILYEINTNLPLFGIEVNGSILFYNYKTNHFELRNNNIVAEYNKEIVEILTYNIITFNEHGILDIKSYYITADYDELVSATKKLYPYYENANLKAEIPLSLFHDSQQKVISDQTVTLSDIEAKVVWQHEKAEKKERSTLINSFEEAMGKVNENQRAIKAVHKSDTLNATNHGPEVNNPYPEFLSEGKYAFFLPDGQWGVLNNAQEICNFINDKRKLGFPLEVNVKWGWDIDQNGQLFIPQKPFNWKELDEKLSELETAAQIEERILVNLILIKGQEANKDFSDNEVNLVINQIQISPDGNFGESSSSSSSTHISDKVPLYQSIIDNNIRNQYKSYASRHNLHIAENNIAKLYFDIQKTRLEPSVVYSHQYENYLFTISKSFGDSGNSFENTLLRANIIKTNIDYFINVEKKIQILEIEERAIGLEQLQIMYQNMNKEFLKTYEHTSLTDNEVTNLELAAYELNPILSSLLQQAQNNGK